MIGGTFLTDGSAYGSMEQAIATFTAAGFSGRDAVRALSTIHCFTVEEQAVYPRPRERAPRYDPAGRRRRIDGAAQPNRFEHGLQVILGGVALLSLPATP